MTVIAPTLQAYFTDRLLRQRRASPHTIRAYRDTIRLLVIFAAGRTRTPASKLTFDDLNAKTISAFLDHLEHDRGCIPGTRNARLAAIRVVLPLLGATAPRARRHDRTRPRDPAQAPRPHPGDLAERRRARRAPRRPDRSTWTGRRDHALILLAAQTGLRASELTNLMIADIVLGAGPHVTTIGKGRRERVTPLTDTTVATITSWLNERAGTRIDPLFPTRTGSAMTRDALARRLMKYATNAASYCPTLHGKTITPHVLRHTAAMRLLHAGIDTSVIALWLGHAEIQTTQTYLHADLELKEAALATAPIDSKPGRYRPPDKLLAFLEAL